MSPELRRKNKWISCAASIASIAGGVVYTFPAAAIVSSGNGTIINDLVGADRFYINGYTGGNSVIANVEGGYIWGGAVDRHQDMQDSSRFGTFFGTGTPATHFDAHATWVGHILGGQGSLPFQQGIAKGATVWSGAIASSWNNALAFNINPSDFLATYTTAMSAGPSGANGRTADVVNSSWGFDPAVKLGVNHSSGYNFYAVAIDALANENRFTTVVFASGNNGGSANSDVLTPADGYNSITVGSLGNETNGYSTISTFSAHGPSDFAMPDANNPDPDAPPVVIRGVRASVDIVAPAENLKLARYAGNTGGNAGSPPNTATNLYSENQFGSSFSAPIVSGGVALLTDAGRSIYGGVNKVATDAIDGRVTKAVLLNSADKIPGWNNGQVLANGVITTTQSLDYLSGAGRMNLNRAFDQYTIGTNNVAGTAGGRQGGAGATVQSTGWDYGAVSEGVSNDYFIASSLASGSTFTITLTWYVDSTLEFPETPPGAVNWYTDSFDNLDMEVWSVAGGVPITRIAESKSVYNNVEHLSFQVPQSTQYMIRVLWAGELYDQLDDVNSENYALAWSNGAVPEPASLGLLALAGVLLRRSRNRVVA